MSKSRKNCLNCAFCVRNRNKFISFGIMSNEKSFWSYNCESLSAEEREMLKQNNDQFIGKEKREYDNWIAEYGKQKKNYQNKKHQRVAELKNNLSKLGMDGFFRFVDVVATLKIWREVL